MRKSTKIGIFVLLIIILAVALSWKFFLKEAFDSDSRLKQYCKENNLVVCNYGSVPCHMDCKKLQLEYFKWDSATFGSSAECWCKEENSTKQIW